ncbi:SpaA isopeptide-forming pilin-related protein [Butyrivibrio sp. NC3005]|uniref:SpaA isopeptide-forming pilin-related protein n=1 Tax=Butyrivibrio sp. NC3005 TaxID=1280685 RepID=UPI000425AE54|nr:SpaA isopeptide-forming pilin-related protein [Butyrivibrio sp. NC3005]
MKIHIKNVWKVFIAFVVALFLLPNKGIVHADNYTAKNDENAAKADGSANDVNEGDGKYYYYITDSSGKSQVAYCINRNKKDPDTSSSSPYTRIKLGDSSELANYVAGGGNESGKNQLAYIVTYGYGGPKSGYGSNISKGVYRVVTQYAIWHITNGADGVAESEHFLPFTGMSSEMVSKVESAWNNESAIAALNLSQDDQVRYQSAQNAVDTYNSILKDASSSSFGSDYTLYIYTYAGKIGKSRQALITADAPVNNKVNIKVSKTAINGTSELPGATLTITSSNGNTVDTWTSTEQMHEVKLTDGEYTLTETTAPSGFEKAESIGFKIENLTLTVKSSSGEYVNPASPNVVHMEDKPLTKTVRFSKTAINGTSELPGAKLEIHDEKGGVVQSWVSTTTPVSFELPDGNYTMVEITAPNGYQVAESIPFTIKNQNLFKGDNIKGSTVHMQDKPTTPEKPDKPDTPNESTSSSTVDNTRRAKENIAPIAETSNGPDNHYLGGIGNKRSSPDTSDTSKPTLWMGLGLFSVVVMLGCLVFSLKKRYHN